MKKIICSLAAVMMMAALVLTFSSCSSDDEDTIFFALRLKDAVVSGKVERPQEVWDYMKAVEDAYIKALNMKEGSIPLLYSDGNYKAKAAEVKSLFESAILPDPIEFEGSYTFTYILEGGKLKGSYDENKVYDVFATKVFTNE